MTNAAIYAHIATIEPLRTSIDNQVMSCQKAAAKEGLVVAEKFIYCDYALSGIRNGLVERIRWHMLIDAITAKQIDILFIEDVLRASLDIYDGLRLMSLVENNNLRVVTTDGLDTTLPNWKVKWLTQLLKAGIKSEESAVRVVHGMLGKLERGYQISKTPFGFKAVRDRTPQGLVRGTTWEIEQDKAELIRDMYSLRKSGKSYSKIAQYLNDSNVAPPRPHLCHGHAYWRPSSVRRILANKIYRGVYVWNGSARAKKASVKEGRELDVREFERPQLRIVSDETWAACNRPKVSVEANTDEA